jgi:hypothetical protein
MPAEAATRAWEGAGTGRALIRKRAKIAWQTPYASRTPEANDAKTAHTSTTESLTESFLYFRPPLIEMHGTRSASGQN